MSTPFAVRRREGGFQVGTLAAPARTQVEERAPANALRASESSFQAAGDATADLRRAILGKPSPLGRATRKVACPLARADRALRETQAKLAAWQAAGSPNQHRVRAVGAAGMPVALPALPREAEQLRFSLEKTARRLSRTSTRQTYAVASPEAQAAFAGQLKDFAGAFAQLQGFRGFEHEVRAVKNAAAELSRFCEDFELPTRLRARTEVVGKDWASDIHEVSVT